MTPTQLAKIEDTFQDVYGYLTDSRSVAAREVERCRRCDPITTSDARQSIRACLRSLQRARMALEMADMELEDQEG